MLDPLASSYTSLRSLSPQFMSPHSPRDSSDWRRVARQAGPSGRVQANLRTAQFLEARNLPRAAEAVYREMLAGEPHDQSAAEGLGELLDGSDRAAEANRVRRDAMRSDLARLEIASDDLDEAVEFGMAAQGHTTPPHSAPQAYLTGLFDQYAECFDDHLELLGYSVPRHLLQMARACLPACQLYSMLDLGCGTGLAGSVLRPLASQLDGVDLSREMLAKAAERDVYDTLIHGEICDHLPVGEAYDVMVAAEVLIYMGRLLPFFTAVANALGAGGIFIATCETGEEHDYELKPSRRYAHRPDFVRRCAAGAGLNELKSRDIRLRRDGMDSVDGVIFAFRQERERLA